MQEREEFEKAQSNAMTKSLSLEEAGPKEKHVRLVDIFVLCFRMIYVKLGLTNFFLRHFRTLVMGTYRNRGADVFWQKLTSKYESHLQITFKTCTKYYIKLYFAFIFYSIPLFANEIVTWKFCVVLHRLMQDGDAKVIAGSIKHGSLIGNFTC